MAIIYIDVNYTVPGRMAYCQLQIAIAGSTMSTTMQDVARLAGVSTKTVSNVLNDYPHVSARMRARVEAAVEELGYRMNVAARSLRSGRSGVIGLALPALSVAYFAELAEQVIHAAEREGFVVVVEQTGTIAREHALFASARMEYMDGLIFNPVDETAADEPARITDLGEMPVILLGDHQIGADAPRVSTDQEAAAAAATELLLARGRRRVLSIGSRPGDTARLRLAGHLQALRSAGVAPEADLVLEAAAWNRRTGAELVTAALSRGLQFDAVFAFNDALALGAMRALQDAGLDVPEDVAVVGFDNLDEGEYSVPSLTSVDPGRAKIADTAVALLVDMIRGKGSTPAMTKLPFHLVERESTPR